MTRNPKTIARRLLRKNRGTASIMARSWRLIAEQDYDNEISPGTLCRFAVSEGAWLPKDEKLLVTLGLKRERKQTRRCMDLFDMATDTLRDALINRQPMPPIDPRILREFIKLGWIKRTRSTR